MMKMTLAATALACLATGLTHAQAPESFPQAVSKAVEAISKRTDVYFVERQNTWIKRFMGLKDVKFDVVRTPSELNPVIGTFSGTVLVGVARAATEADAGAASEPTSPISPSSRVELKFTRNAGRWSLLEGKEFFPEASFDIKPFDRNSPRPTPAQAVITVIEQSQP